MKSPAVTARRPASKPVGSVPILSSWKENADGSITGRISNSANFRAGEKITTSAVRMGAKAGSTVVTKSKLKYLLD